MKTTINITLGGVLFFVEDDAYQSLKAYLDHIERHFSTIEDGNEIVKDIEYRMAELLQARLKQRQGVTMADVDFLKQTVGYPQAEDFTTEEEAIPIDEPKKKQEYWQDEPQLTSAQDPFNMGRRLYRDLARKKVGGVLAGLANYFGVETLWLRLGYIFFFFGFWIFPALPGFLFLAYILFLIVIKGRTDLPEPMSTGAKLYRDPNDKVIAGVSSGIAQFLHIDPTVVRILFFASLFFFGSGFFVYIVLWILAPMADSRADFLRMRGVPVTVQNMQDENSNLNWGSSTKAVSPISSTLGTLGKIIVGFVLLVMAFPLMLVGIELLVIHYQLYNGWTVTDIIQNLSNNRLLANADLEYKFGQLDEENLKTMVLTVSSLFLIPGLLFVLGALQFFFQKKLLNTTLVFWAIFIYLFAIGAVIVQAINF